MRHVHAARECVRVGVQRAFSLPNAITAGEDHIGALQQCTLALHQLRRRTTKGRQLVHAVVDDHARRQMRTEALAHRRVVPQQQVAYAQIGQVAIQQAALHLHGLLALTPGGQARHQDVQAVLFATHLQPGLGCIAGDGLLPEQHIGIACKARHQVLRSLIDKTPAQMRQTQQRGPRRIEPRRAVGRNRAAGLADRVLELTSPTHGMPS